MWMGTEQVRHAEPDRILGDEVYIADDVNAAIGYCDPETDAVGWRRRLGNVECQAYDRTCEFFHPTRAAVSLSAIIENG